MPNRILLALAAAALCATPALAQTQKPAATKQRAPTTAECNQGWKKGSAWTKQEFVDACAAQSKATTKGSSSTGSSTK